jgi:hypothetical protein
MRNVTTMKPMTRLMGMPVMARIGSAHKPLDYQPSSLVQRCYLPEPARLRCSSHQTELTAPNPKGCVAGISGKRLTAEIRE